MELSVSILNSQDKIETIKKLNSTNIDYFHIDAMDGKFVSNISLPISEIKEISKISEKQLDVHLMVQEPKLYIEELKYLKNIDYITIHLEIDKDIQTLINKIKSYNIKAGLSIKPNTDINLLIPYLQDIDLILIMTVEPGLGGQPFLMDSQARIKKVKELVQKYNPNIKIEVDGGINNETINLVKESDIAVVGSYITTASDPISQIDKLLV